MTITKQRIKNTSLQFLFHITNRKQRIEAPCQTHRDVFPSLHILYVQKDHRCAVVSKDVFVCPERHDMRLHNAVNLSVPQTLMQSDQQQSTIHPTTLLLVFLRSRLPLCDTPNSLGTILALLSYMAHAQLAHNPWNRFHTTTGAPKYAYMPNPVSP